MAEIDHSEVRRAFGMAEKAFKEERWSSVEHYLSEIEEALDKNIMAEKEKKET